LSYRAKVLKINYVGFYLLIESHSYLVVIEFPDQGLKDLSTCS